MVIDSQLPARRLRLGIDIGGTFTDFSLIDERTSAVVTHKVRSVPSAPSQAVARGIGEITARIGAAPHDITSFVHGTTIALNAVLERRGAEVALLVTAGTRDVLELGRLRKPDLFNLRAAPTLPLVPRRNVFELTGRISADGREALALDEDEIKRVVAALPATIDSIAVCLLNAYANPAHERRVEAVLGALRPDLPVSRSTALWPEIREYERAIVATLNAYVQPIVGRYVENLERDTAAIGVRTRLYITRSNGGIMPAAAARARPVFTMLSGPASGVVGAAYVAGLAGVTDAVTIDIGGTSADVAVIRDGEPVQSTEAAVGDFPMIMPAVDVFAVGAGGGSIAWFDEAGLLKLGPQSAGAMPGPACYGSGGSAPTTTDAYLVCGYLDPATFAGGSIRLEPILARRAIETVARRLGTSTEQAAESILTLATNTMAGAILPMLTKRGIDARGFTLVAFGGAGPTHACLLAEELGIARILVPPSPGTMCAHGAAIADLRYDTVRSFRTPADGADAAILREALADLERDARRWLADERPDIAALAVQRTVGMRYRGQAFDIDVALPADLPTERLRPDDLVRLFHETYEALYRNSDASAPVELVDLRVAVIGQIERPRVRRLPPADGAAPVVGRRTLFHRGRAHEAEVHARDALAAGHTVRGPAVIDQPDTTTVVLPGFLGHVDASGSLVLTRASA